MKEYNNGKLATQWILHLLFAICSLREMLLLQSHGLLPHRDRFSSIHARGSLCKKHTPLRTHIALFYHTPVFHMPIAL